MNESRSIFDTASRTRIIVTYGVLISLLVMAIRLFESSFFLGRISEKLYVTAIGILFLAVGLGVGLWLRKRPEERAARDEADATPQPLKEESGVVSPVVTQTVVRSERCEDLPSAPLGVLTRREREVLEQIARGLSNREIAAHLFLSENTIKTHINNIYAKLDVRRRTQAVARAKELGMMGRN